MNTEQLKDLCKACLPIVDSVANFIQGEVGRVKEDKIETKSLNSLVSYVDKTAEEMLVGQLSALLPGSVFLTEEGTVAQSEGEYQWIIDPLDGTTNFLHQLPYFAVSVGLRHRDVPVLGIVQEVTRKESFYAWKGGGAYLNGTPIAVAATTDLRESLVATGFPYRHFDRMEGYFTAMKQLMATTRGLRRYGASAVDLAYVACGRYELFFEYGLSPWDVAAGIVIVEEAGGKLADFGKGTDFLFGGEMIAACPGIMEAAAEIIFQSFSEPKKTENRHS